MMNNRWLAMYFIITVGWCETSVASLIDHGDGMIYDSTLDITWLQDTNYAFTSGYAAANATNNGAGATDNIFSDGRMGWNAATTWVDGLEIGGYTDWRLFNADPVCGWEFNCTGNDELGHLFYIDFGVTAGQSILSSTDPDLALFLNLQANYYWSGTERRLHPVSLRAWEFSTRDGKQRISNMSEEMYVWAVRSGDAVPEPSTVLLLTLGLLGIAGAKQVQRRKG
ncbi:MAG: DUF1566 domain-containing protein [gamma proteobacterium endosymbiont of Lamellibrachia anaximandri]|nr:DUF1566 domain-containing protein [gamma proteobacterium endosymbiont of Lamellibrachia anaximandri]MBL3535521.1 DUF1566 domain-containing protein [gamma proteobacterium endosymbiont of Lamellibrachia anaximandri]